jgi:hypothetical protein
MLAEQLGPNIRTTIYWSGSAKIANHWLFATPITPQAIRAPESPAG